ncbi:MAG TPA: TetR family transcriptional regulator [Solirubrobacterales bacterium]|nr:TetR family transcriptional regulator [Solirubrobacterales bacterium]
MRPATAEAAPTSRRAVQRAERRGAILEATIDIVTTEGLGAVTHRAVAKQAGVPLAATTYYFSSKDEMIGEALGILVSDEIDRLSRRARELGEEIRSPRAAASAVAEVLFPDFDAVGGLLAKLELYLEAARRPGLYDAAAHWQEAFTDLARESLAQAGVADPGRLAPFFIAAADGILLHALSEGVTGDEDVARMRDRLEQLFTLVLEG